MLIQNIEDKLIRFGPLSLKDLIIVVTEEPEPVLKALSLLAEKNLVETILVEADLECRDCGDCGQSEPETMYRWVT